MLSPRWDCASIARLLPGLSALYCTTALVPGWHPWDVWSHWSHWSPCRLNRTVAGSAAGSAALTAPALTTVPTARRHTASYGMSGPSMLNVSRIHEVNVGGTQNVIDCAAELGVAVIYTSS